jgi:TetR/AcrR family transcriptional regulator, transcriptional repressor for nem operon
MEENLKGKDVVQQILNVAHELFQDRGYNAFSYRDLSKEVGIRTSSIHYHFPTKGDLAKTLVERYREHFNALRSQIESQAEDPKKKLELYFQLFIDNFKACKKVCPCSMLATDFTNLPKAVQEQVRGLFDDNEAWIARVLDEGRNAGAFEFKGSPERMARMIFSALEGSTISARIYESEHRLSYTSDWIMRMLSDKN